MARRLDALLAAEPELTPHEVAGAVGPGPPARGAARRRRLQPDPRPRPDGAALRRRRPAQGDRQPRPLRHRRRRLDRRSARPSAAAARRSLALMGDVTFLHDANGLVLGPRRARARTSRSWSSTTTAARSSRCSSRAPRSTPTASTRSSAPRTASTSPACAPRPGPRTGRSTRSRELEHALANPNGGIEVVEARRPPRQPARPRRPHPRRCGSTDRASADQEREARRDEDQLMTTSPTPSPSFVDHLAEALDDPRITEASGEEWAARLHFSRYHFDRMIKSVAGEPPQRVPPAHPARAGGVPDDHHRPRPSSTSPSRRATARTRRSRGRSPGRTASPPATWRTQARTHPDRGAQRRALPPTRQPSAARTRQGELHGPAHEDGRAPHLADRRDGAPGRTAHRRTARPADRARRRRRRADDPLAARPG